MRAGRAAGGGGATIPANATLGITGIVGIGAPGMTGNVGVVGELKPLSTDANGTTLAPAGNGD